MMDLSPKYNPFERGLLRFIVMHCFSTQSIKELENFKSEEFNFKALHWVWSVCLVALQGGTFPFKAYIKPQKLENLKMQLTNMVTMARFRIEFHLESKTQACLQIINNIDISLPNN